MLSSGIIYAKWLQAILFFRTRKFKNSLLCVLKGKFNFEFNVAGKITIIGNALNIKINKKENSI